MQTESGQTQTRVARPHDAASLILVDRSGASPRFLMGLRHERHSFMPGYMVFPGGRLDASDRHMRVYGMLSPHTERNLMAQTVRPSPAKARALALCALREMFEETGMLIGESDLGAPPVSSEAWRGFAEHGVYPSAEALHFMARAITPPAFPRRYDTRFFIAEAQHVALTVEGAFGPDSELTQVRWLTRTQAEAENLAPITRVILGEAARRLDEGLENDLPVPFFRELRGLWRRDEI